MFDIIKSVILAGGYKLEEIQRKVQKFYAIGTISEEQMDELLAMAAAGVSTESERPDMLTMFLTLADRLATCETRLDALEGTNPDTEPDTDPDTNPDEDPEVEPEEYEEWKPWDGISNKYQLGAIVSHNGKLWESIFNGQNVWEPGALGTDNLWKLYEA